MELALNLLWLAVSALLLAAWLRAPSRRRLGGLTQGFMLLGCVILLLFPPISISDDLHATLDAVEEVSVSARKAHPVSFAQHDAGYAYPARDAFIRLSFVETVIALGPSLPRCAVVTSAVSRAPPAA